MPINDGLKLGTFFDLHMLKLARHVFDLLLDILD